MSLSFNFNLTKIENHEKNTTFYYLTDFNYGNHAKENEECSSTSISDQTIAQMVQSSSDLVYMTSSAKSLQTPGNFRIKMNSTAASAFRNSGKSTYPNNSMLVREALDQNGNVTGSDIMYRSMSDPNAHQGWIWTSLKEERNVKAVIAEISFLLTTSEYCVFIWSNCIAFFCLPEEGVYFCPII